MMKLTGFVAASVCSLFLAGSSVRADESQPRVTADWQDGFAPDYSNYGPGSGPAGDGRYDQWSPNLSSQFDPSYSTYGGPPNGGQFPNSGSPFAPGQGRRRGCHHGRGYSGGPGYPSPFNGYSSGPMTAPNYGDQNWGAAPYGPATGAPYGPGSSQSLGPGSDPNQPQFFGQGRTLPPQAPSSSFGPSNAPQPSLPIRGFQNQSYPSQNFNDPYSPLNQPLNSYNQQPNTFGPSPNQYRATPQSFGQPSYNQPGYSQPSYNQPSYNQPGYNQPNMGFAQPGSSFGQPRANFGQPAPVFNQPQSSPFYP